MSRGFLNYFLNIVRIENTIVIVLAISTIPIVVVLIVFTSLSFTIIIITQIQEFVKLSDCTKFIAKICATCTSRKPRPAPSSTALAAMFCGEWVLAWRPSLEKPQTYLLHFSQIEMSKLLCIGGVFREKIFFAPLAPFALSTTILEPFFDFGLRKLITFVSLNSGKNKKTGPMIGPFFPRT